MKKYKVPDTLGKYVHYFSYTGFFWSEHRLAFSCILEVAIAAGASQRRRPRERLLAVCFLLIC